MSFVCSVQTKNGLVTKRIFKRKKAGIAMKTVTEINESFSRPINPSLLNSEVFLGLKKIGEKLIKLLKKIYDKC